MLAAQLNELGISPQQPQTQPPQPEAPPRNNRSSSGSASAAAKQTTPSSNNNNNNNVLDANIHGFQQVNQQENEDHGQSHNLHRRRRRPDTAPRSAPLKIITHRHLAWSPDPSSPQRSGIGALRTQTAG